MHGVEEIQDDKQQSTRFWKGYVEAVKGFQLFQKALKQNDSRVNKNRPLYQK